MTLDELVTFISWHPREKSLIGAGVKIGQWPCHRFYLYVKYQISGTTSPISIELGTMKTQL